MQLRSRLLIGLGSLVFMSISMVGGCSRPAKPSEAFVELPNQPAEPPAGAGGSGLLLSELTVETDFEGGSAKVVAIDQQERSIRFEPGGDPRHGWPCWWNFRIRGARPGETLTLRLRALSESIPQSAYGWLKDKPLSLDWASPSRAAWSIDGENWQRTEPGTREGHWMIYRLKATTDALLVAWGPTYTPSRAGEFAHACARQHPAVVKAESLCQSRDGRSVTLLRIAEGPRPIPQRGAIWVQARQHAWESGSSWIAQGFTEWLLADSLEATWLRQHHEIFVVPVMDVDHVASGQGGKEAIPQDQNRDWTDRPHWPEVAAAQAAIRVLIRADRMSAFIDLHNPGPNDRAIHFHTPPDEGTKPGQRAAIDRFNLLAKTHLSKVMPVQEKVVKSGANYNPNWMQMSHCWVAAHAPENTLALCIETPWNIDQSSQEGYRRMGAAIGLTIFKQFHDKDSTSPDK
ncbi:MAG: zinc carboxypeptidase [Planctomycetes bacterium]|nr:zinc carboxypeptidase [Planctomycetota bacterium]